MRRREIERLLPVVFQRTIARGAVRAGARSASDASPSHATAAGDPIGALLDVMETLHAPSEAILADIDACFDPRRAPDRLVPFLARWVDLDLPVTTGLGRARELVARAVTLAGWRGTRRGLCAFLVTATGAPGFRIDESVPDDSGRPRPFHIAVTAPAACAPHRAMIERIIEREKPAWVTWELRFQAQGGGT